MITGIDWYECQIREKEKQLKKHNTLAKLFKGQENEQIYQQLAYDDQQYLIMLKYALENAMWYKDPKDENIGWCADK